MTKMKLLLAVALASCLIQGSQAEVYGEEAPADTEKTNSTKFKPLPRAGVAGVKNNERSESVTTKVQSPALQEERWHLTAGHLVRQELTRWAERSGWKVLWHLQRDWAVPADTDFTGDFKAAAAEVIRTLAENGVVIRGQFYDANKTLVVSGASPLTPDPQ